MPAEWALDGSVVCNDNAESEGSTVKLVSDVFVEAAYRRVNSEEGGYDAFAGWNVFVYVDGEDGLRDAYGYGGPDGTGALWVFSDEASADAFVAHIRKRGRFMRDDYWVHVGSTDSNALPDYVENYWRPEYN